MTWTLYFNNGKVCPWQRVTVQLNIKLLNTSWCHPETQDNWQNAHRMHSHLALEHMPMSCCCPSPKQAELTLRGCTLATGAVPLCLEWRQEMRQEKAPKNVVFMLPTLCINFLPWDHEKGKHCIQWKDVYHQHKTRLSWRSNSPLRRWCFINWAMLLRAELLTTLRWGLPVHEPHVSRSTKYSYQVKLSACSLDRSRSHSKLIAFLCTLRVEVCVCVCVRVCECVC